MISPVSGHVHGYFSVHMSPYYRHWFTEAKTPENLTALQLHLSIGVTIGVIVVLRILWRIANRTPDLEPGSRLEHTAVKLGHFALYAVMIIMPITGYLGTGADIPYFFQFDIPSFKNTALFANNFGDSMSFKEFEKPFDFVSKEILGAWLVWLLILGHVSAALYHQFVKDDRTLRRMTTGQ